MAPIADAQAMREESRCLENCLDKPYMIEKQETGRLVFFALRDASGRSVATLAIEPAMRKDSGRPLPFANLTEARGKYNGTLNANQLDAVIEFLNRHRITVGADGSPLSIVKTGLMQVNGRILKPDELPDGYHHPSDLILKGLPVHKLPQRLAVDGTLDISNTAIPEIPDGTYVKGDVIAENTPIAHYPKNLNAGGSQNFNDTQIADVPPFTHVKGNLGLRGTRLTKTPEGLMVDGSLNLNQTAVHFGTMHPSIRVKGQVHMSNYPYLSGQTFMGRQLPSYIKNYHRTNPGYSSSIILESTPLASETAPSLQTTVPGIGHSVVSASPAEPKAPNVPGPPTQGRLAPRVR